MKKLITILVFSALIAVSADAEFILVPRDVSTIQEGIDAASDGDVVLISAGTYTGSLNRNLTIGRYRNIIIRAVEGDSVVIDCEGLGTGFIFSECRSELDGITIINGSTDGKGGAVRLDDAFPQITGCEFRNNYAYEGGGALAGIGNCWPLIEDCLFEENTTGDTIASRGGALFFQCDGFASPHLKRSIIKNNQAYSGGGAYYSDGDSPKFFNNIFTGNVAFKGGAVSGFDVTLVFLHNNFVLNDAEQGRGVFVGEGAVVKLVNSIVWGNSGEGEPDQILCWSEGEAVVNYSDIEGGWEGFGNIDSDPMFVSSEEFDFHLQEISPCLNIGDDSWDVDVDMENDPRPYGGGCDIGADEFLKFRITDPRVFGPVSRD